MYRGAKLSFGHAIVEGPGLGFPHIEKSIHRHEQLTLQQAWFAYAQLHILLIERTALWTTSLFVL